LQVGVLTADPGEDRRPGPGVFPGAGGGLRHRRRQGQAAGPQAQDLGEEVDLSFGVAALPAGRALRAGQAVTLLPVPQPRDGYPGAPGHFADRQDSGAGVTIREP
jgi:hypothetical protein